MTIGASLFCLVVGAILTFAIETDSTDGININNVGVILMVVGLVGLVVYGLLWGPRTRRIAGPSTFVEDAPVIRRVVVDEPVVEERVVRSRPTVERRVYGP